MTATTTTSTLDGGAPGNGTPIIETVGLTKTYSGTDFRAVDGLNLRVGTGEVFGLLGPNGAGKTTTIGVLTTRVIPTDGQALIGGIDVVQQPTLIKQLIGAEDPSSPLTDSRIADLLGDQGIVVARRTIAKYREALQIPPVNLRKAI